jgi:hypothetical protein
MGKFLTNVVSLPNKNVGLFDDTSTLKLQEAADFLSQSRQISYSRDLPPSPL